MADRPILFSKPMVRALLDGRKTQTRRLSTSPLRRCEPGDRLWARESFRFWAEGDDCEITYADGSRFQTGPCTGDIPDAALEGYFNLIDRCCGQDGERRSIGVPSIHMPRWASRMTLPVQAVRVEPLQAISRGDAIAEGIERETAAAQWRTYDGGPPALGPRESYASLWASLHSKEGERWEDNPEVLALTFSVQLGNIDRQENGRG